MVLGTGGQSPIPDQATIDRLDALAKLFENHGAMLIFAICSGLLNMYFVIGLATGHFVPGKWYRRALSEVERLQKAIDKNQSTYMAKMLKFLGGLKPGPKGGDEDGDDN